MLGLYQRTQEPTERGSEKGVQAGTTEQDNEVVSACNSTYDTNMSPQ